LLEKLLLVGIALMIAALVGGGLEAAGIKLPILSSKGARLAVGTFGAVIMVFAYLSVQSTNADKLRANFETKLDRVVMGASGIPTPPPWSSQAVADELEGLSVAAGSDVGMNCEIANFVRIHKLPIGDWPTTLQQRFVSAGKGDTSPALICYRQAIDAASAQRGSCASQTVGAIDTPGDLPYRPEKAAVSASDVMTGEQSIAFAQFYSTEPLPSTTMMVAQSAEVAPDTGDTTILESLAAVGQNGWMYLGVYDGSSLSANNRTIIESTPGINSAVTVREPVNLRSAGGDTDFRHHKIISVIPPRSQVLIKALTPQTEQYRWALVQILRVGGPKS
jgi:hypothetical protein